MFDRFTKTKVELDYLSISRAYWNKTVHRQDNSPTRFWRQFIDRIEDSFL